MSYKCSKCTKIMLFFVLIPLLQCSKVILYHAFESLQLYVCIVIHTYLSYGHLQTDLRTLNVKMTFRVGGGYPHDVNVQKCMKNQLFW